MVLCLAVTIGFRDTKHLGNASGMPVLILFLREELLSCTLGILKLTVKSNPSHTKLFFMQDWLL